ncbi:MAG: hypothetical protein ACTSSP_03100 [Candidatus Asgardarchaeia archaeon]
MTRTYRNYPSYVDGPEYGNPIRYWHRRKGEIILKVWFRSHAGYYLYNTHSCRDQKPHRKSPKFWKRHQWKRRRAKTGQAMIRKDYDNLPYFRTENDWLWD